MRFSSRRPLGPPLVCIAVAASVVIVVAACGEDTTTIPTVPDGDGGSTGDPNGDPTGTGTGTGSSGGEGGGDGGPTHDAGRDAGRDAGHDAGKDSGPPNDPGCPAAFDAQHDLHCTLGLTCSYPEGSCACLGACGGIVLPDDPSHWVCVARDAACPPTAPTKDQPCAASSETTCEYPECCTHTYTCKAGAWTTKPAICPL